MAGLMREATRLGVSVHICRLEPQYGGLYDDEKSRIYLQLGLTMPQLKQVLAHELGHALHRHPCSSGMNERQADKRAAWLLIDPQAYADAESVDDHPEAIADELGVTLKVIEDYRRYWLSEARTSASLHR